VVEYSHAQQISTDGRKDLHCRPQSLFENDVLAILLVVVLVLVLGFLGDFEDEDDDENEEEAVIA
jgi:hypothetical protein